MDKPGSNRYKNRYFSYLLRVWQEGDAGNPWRASLDNSEASGRVGFSSLEALFEYIRQKTVKHGSVADVPARMEMEEKARQNNSDP